MDFLRQKISGNKNRYKDKEFNLDLSYITPRIIAMAIPGEGLVKLYRNNINDIQKFFKAKHNNKFLIINLSGIKYDYSRFENNVIEYEWIDHQAPRLVTLFHICEKVFLFLSKDINNVVAINCKAGKGRTGTIICCLMLFFGLFNNINDAFNYYSIKRFKFGEGVSQPSQKRYVEFFNNILNSDSYFPKRVILKEILLCNPSMKDRKFLKPYIEISNNNSGNLDYSNKLSYYNQQKLYFGSNKNIPILHNNYNLKNYLTKNLNSQINTLKKSNTDGNLADKTYNNYNSTSFNSNKLEVTNEGIILANDFTISIFDYYFSNVKLLGRISYNTLFIDPTLMEVKFRLNQIDPDNLLKDGFTDKDFNITVRQ